MNKILFLKPYFSEKIWGSDNLKQFGFKLPSSHTGEAWVVSGYKGKSSVITNGEYKGISLYDLYKKNKKIFNNPKTKEYPLLVKLLDCNDDLSIQVHPKDKYAKEHFNEFGKNECWYVLGAKKNGSIIYGHNAKTKKELVSQVKNGEWKKLLKNKKVKHGDFIYVPTGTIHALKSGLLIYELQQSSDVTFRLYDYDRQKVDPSRKLHIKESLDNISAPFEIPKYTKNKETLIKTKSFTLKKINNSSQKTYFYRKAKWLQCTVIDGLGELVNFKQKIKKGDSFLVVGKSKMELKVKGKVKILVSYAN